MSIEAMKLALEALEKCRYGFEYTRQYVGYETLPAIKGWSWYDGDVAAQAAITALRQAIEQAQQVEPVAWGVDWGKAGDIPCVSIIKRLPDGVIEVLAVEYGPPPRQPLTDEETYKIQTSVGYSGGFS